MTIARSSTPRLRPAGDSAILIELEAVIDPAVNATAIAIGSALRSATVAGVRDVVTTYRSVAVFFDPLVTADEELRSAVDVACRVAPQVAYGAQIEIPVSYGGEDGPDLQALATWAGLTPEAVIERHASATYRVFMLGFLPGFAYMGSVDAAIAAPRRATPRTRVPAGSVGIAGRQTGIYPRESPGGWQLIGRTHTALFDPGRQPASLLRPGDSVTFVRDGGSTRKAERVDLQLSSSVPLAPSRPARALTILNPGLFTTVQDLGRWGYQGSGVPLAGAMDPVAHAGANALVGNDPSAATLEATLTGPEIRFEGETMVAVAGGDLAASVDGAPLPVNSTRRCDGGAVLRFAGRRSGARAYIACDGGLDVPIVLGSRATHTLSGMGGVDGRAVKAGDRIRIGDRSGAGSVSRSGSGSGSGWGSDRHLTPTGGARVRVLPGPQDDVFDPSALDILQRSRFVVSPQSNRMGYRLTGAVIPSPPGEMISDVTFPGAIQVPPSGDPILLMADRQTVGGYAQLATVITADLPIAGQLAPGDWIEFAVCSQQEALTALADQQRAWRSRG